VEPEVGPSTNTFILDTADKSNKVQIYLDRKVYQCAKELREDATCNRIEPSNSHYQLRQLRSKFEELETYDKMKASFDALDLLADQPLTIYTLAAHPKVLPSDDHEKAANYVLASEVTGKKYKSRLEKDVAESIFFKFKEPNQQIPKIFKDTLSLYGEIEEEIRILSNNELNRRLVQLASKLSSYIIRTKEIIANIKTHSTAINKLFIHQYNRI
jgi:hypothetical protein